MEIIRLIMIKVRFIANILKLQSSLTSNLYDYLWTVHSQDKIENMVIPC
jgi:hypothetical protein